MINVQSSRYPKYPDLVIAQCMHISKYHMYPINRYNYYVLPGPGLMLIIPALWEAKAGRLLEL